VVGNSKTVGFPQQQSAGADLPYEYCTRFTCKKRSDILEDYYFFFQPSELFKRFLNSSDWLVKADPPKIHLCFGQVN